MRRGKSDLDLAKHRTYSWTTNIIRNTFYSLIDARLQQLTHVPLIRAKFRAEHLAIEHMLCTLIAAGKGKAVLEEMKVQFGLARDAHRNVLFDNLDEVPSFPEQNQL